MLTHEKSGNHGLPLESKIASWPVPATIVAFAGTAAALYSTVTYWDNDPISSAEIAMDIGLIASTVVMAAVAGGCIYKSLGYYGFINNDEADLNSPLISPGEHFNMHDVY